MTTENRRFPFAPRAVLAALGLALALMPSAANAAPIPLLSSATFSAGTEDQATAVARDGFGNLFVVGYSSAAGTGRDIWVSRWNEASLTLVSSMTFNGSASGTDAAQAVAIDTAGVVYVMGVSSVTGQGPSLWMGRFSSSLAVLGTTSYAIPLNNATWGNRKGLLVLPTGNLIVVNDTPSGGNDTILLAEIYADLTVASSTTFFGGFNSNYGFGVARDASGNLYVAGSAAPAPATSPNLWIGKFDPAMAFVSSATVAGGGGAVDEVRDVAIGSDANIYVSGFINNSGFAELWLGKYSPSLTLLNSASFPVPGSLNSLANSLVATSDRLFTVGRAEAALQSYNVVISEFDYNLVMLSSASFTTPGAAYDEGWDLAVDTNTGAAYVVGMVNPSVPQVWVAKYQVSGGPSYPGCAVTANVGAGQVFPTIQAGVNYLPPVLAGHACVVIRDGAVYNEYVKVQNFVAGGSSITIMADPGSGLRPVVMPPAASTAAFRIASASVSIKGLDIVANQSVPYGVWASSAYFQLTNVAVSTAGSAGFYTAGVRLSSSSWVSYSSVTAWNAHGIWLEGAYSGILHSTAVSKNTNTHGLYLLGADSNTVTNSLFQNPQGSAVRLDGGSDYNTLTNSVMTSNLLSYYALYFNASDDNTATGLSVENPNGNGIAFYTGADRNTVSLSTVVSGGNGQGVAYVGSDWNTLTTSYVQNLGAWGVYIHTGSDNNTVSMSTVVVNSAIRYALYIHTSASNTITQSAFSNPSGDAARLEYSHFNTISQSGMTSDAANKSALYLTVSSYNLVTQSFVSNPSGFGLQLLDAGRNKIDQATIQNSTPTAPALKITATAPNRSVYNLVSRSDVYNPAGHAGQISFNANNNDVQQSTFTSFSGIHRALEINSVSSTTISRTFLSNSSGYGLAVSFSTGVSIIESRVDSSAGFGLYVDVSSGVKFIGSKAQGNPAVYVRSSTQTAISAAELYTTSAGKALWVANGNVGFSAVNVWIDGFSASDGVLLDGPNTGALTFSSLTITGPNFGFGIAPQGPGAVLSVSSVTFQALNSGATAFNFIGGTFVSTFSGMNFADSSIGTNVNGMSLGGGSRITMLAAGGMRGGPTFENDPAGFVDWPNFGLGGITAAPFTAVTNVALTANWNSSFAPGTNYTAELSTGGFPNSFGGNQSFVTTNLYQVFSGLNGGTPYFARVSTNAATGPFTLLGSTVTPGGSGAGTIAALGYTGVSANSLTANWNSTFGAGTVYHLRISTNSFATVNASSATTNVNFFFGGLLPATSYEVRVSTLAGGVPFTGLGVVTTPAVGGGGVSFNFNNVSQGAVIASANGQNEMGLGIIADPVPNGDVYVIFGSTPGATGARNALGHDTAGVVGIVRYGAEGNSMSSRTLASDSHGGLARDGAGNIFVAETDRSLGLPLRINKFSPDLITTLGSVVLPLNGNFGPMISTGNSIVALIEDAGDSTAKIINYDSAGLVATATAAPYAIGGFPLKGHGMGVRSDVGFLYVLVSSVSPNAPVHVLRYSYPGGFNGSTPLDITIPDVTTRHHPRLAVSGDKLYVAFTDLAAASIIVRQYSGSIGYTGFSSTMTGVTAPFGLPAAALVADDQSVFVGGTVNTGGGGDYLIKKLDPNNGLAFVSSGTFNSAVYMTDQLRALAIGPPGEIFVTGASSNSANDANALTTGMYLGAGGGQSGAIAAAPYTSVSTTSFIANWETNFPNGTLYYLELSTNGFITSVIENTTLDPYFVYGGLLPGSTYEVRVGTAGFGGSPTTQLGVVATLGAGVSISGTLSYAGLQDGMIRVEAFVTPAFTGAPASSQVLSNMPSQPYYLPVGAGTFYVRAYVDVFGGGAYYSWLEQGTTGPFTLSASSLTARNFSIAVDSVAPNSPLGLYASPSGGQVFLSWNAPTTSTNGATLQDLRGYIVRRSTGGGAVEIGGSAEFPLSSANQNFTDFAPVPNVSNYYTVVAVDYAGNQSLPSSPASVSGGTGGSGGTIYGHREAFTLTTSGSFRVRLSSHPSAAHLAESTQEYYNFPGLSSGTYYLSGFRDLNDNGVQETFEPAGWHGGLNNNPFPIYVSGTNSVFADVTLCDRELLQVGSPVNGYLDPSGCPARDAGPNRTTELLAFEAGTGSAGSISTGTALTLFMTRIAEAYDSRLIVLGPSGQMLANNSSPGGAAVSLTPVEKGVYIVEPTSFYDYTFGGYTLTMSAGSSGQATDGITGTLSYPGAQSGNVVVRFFNNASFAGVPVAAMTVGAGAGSFSGLSFDKRNLPLGTYFVDAFRDTAGSGVFNPSYQAYGQCSGGSGITITEASPLVNVGNCALADPAAGGGGGNGSLSGAITFNGSLSGTVRTSLFMYGSEYPVANLSTAFASTMPYSFTGLGPGTYFVKAFADPNDNYIPDAGEHVALSPAVGIGLPYDAVLTGQNFALCARAAIAEGVPVTADWTAADCPAADRDGAYMKMYTFTGTRGQSVTLEAKALNFYGTFLALYDPEGNLAAFDDGAAGGNAKIAEYALPFDGLYTIGASPYAPGVTGRIELSYRGSNGALGSISGTVDYQGTQGGRVMVVLFDSPSFSSSSYLDDRILVSTRTFRFDNLFAGSSYYLGAFVDVNYNNVPDENEDKGQFGATSPNPIYLSAGQNMTGASILIGASTAAAAGASYLTGEVYYSGAQTGQVTLEFWPGGDFSGRPVAVRNIPTGIVLSSASYDVSLPGGVNYFIRAFLDANGDFVPNPSEPKGVYSPYGQGAEPVFVPAGQTLSGINVTMTDPGQTAGGAVAGEGSAVITSTSIAGGQIFSMSLVYTAGASGIQVGGKVGMTVPPVFPFPFASAQGSSVTARSGSSLSPVNYSGPSVFVTLNSALAAGATVGFEWSNVYAPCYVGTATFTVTSVSNGTASPVPLFAGSPSVPVVAGQPAFFQLNPPYFSVKQGELSDLNYLEARDLCANKVPLTAAEVVEVRGSYYDPASGQFTLDPDIGLATGTAVSTASAISVNFAVGQSSRPFFVISASTGFKNLEAFYDLQYPTTFYFGVNALPANALTGVYVSTTSGATALSSASISLGANGLTNQIFVGFTLGDPQQSWRVLFSSIPFKPGVPPSPVWERWGYGQPSPGEIAWDGRFNPWINGGARVPNGLYYGRVEVGGSGVKNDSLRVAVSLPSFAGRMYDPAVTPNPPLSDVQLRVYGPSGYFTAVTGDDGSYTMPGLGAGVYRLNLSRTDYVDGVVDMTLDAAGKATAFTSRTAGLAVSSNATGGLDAYLGRAPRLIVVPSLDASIPAADFDQWGNLQVRSSTGANANTIYGPMRLKAGTTTFDDGGQWDSATQQFVEKTLLAFNVPVGTYSVVAELSGYSRSTGAVYVGANGARLDLPAFTRKSVVTGQVFVASNPSGLGVSVVAVPLSTATSAGEGGFAHVFLNPGTTSSLYTLGGLEGGSYILRANAQGLSAASLGPVTVPSSGTLAQQDFAPFGAGASIFGTINTVPALAGATIYMNAWSPGSFNFGSAIVYTNGAGAASYSLPGLDASASYQLFVNIGQSGGSKAEYDGGFPKIVTPSGAPQNFTMTAASGVVVGTIYLQADATDFLNVVLYGKTLAALRPERVGEEFVEVSTTMPGFSCGGQPANSPSSAPVAGYCPGVSSATFLVTGANTETIELSFLHKTSGQSSKQVLSIVNGATSTVIVDLSSQTFAISGSIANQIIAAQFNTNPKIVENAPYIAPLGYPAGLSSSTARVTAIRQDIGAYGVAISTVFNPLTSRVGFITASGTFTITNVPKGVYLVRTVDLRACATCPVLVPSVGKVVSVAGASVSSVTLALSDGYSVSGSISLDGGILDSRIFDVSVVNRRQEVVRSTVVYLGDANVGVTANSVDYSFTNLPAGEFYTLTVRGRLFPIKYTGKPIKFPDASLSPNGLQSSLTGQNVLMKRAAYIVGRLKDAATGESIRAANATILAPNFAITATANPWTEGGFVVAAASISARPIEGDSYFRVGPLLPDVNYDLRLAQATWDPNFLASGSQNYAPVTISGLKPTPGEIRDVGVVSLGQGQSITGIVKSTATGLSLGNIKVTARPSFGGDAQLVVQSFTNSQGAYSLWVSSAVSNQFNLVVAPRDGNQASDGRYYGTVELTNVNLLTQTTANFFLTPLPVIVTGQVLVADAATGGALSYPFGDKRGFPAAAINLQPAGVVSEDPLGDIEATTDERGFFTVPGLSTGIYRLHATSLGYAVYNATVQVIGSSFSIFTGTNTQTGGVLTLARGATATGRILKSDGTSPNSDEVVGVAAANFAAGEFVVGSVETDAVAKTVSAYTISGFKTGIAYDIVLLSGSSGKEVSFPTEGAGVSFSASESTTTKTINLTYRPARLDCLGTAKSLNAARSQFLVQIDCLKPLRQESAADDDLTTILTVSTFTSTGASFTAPNGTGVLSNPSNSTSRRLLTATYSPATNETRFSIRIRASAAEVDPNTGENFAIDKVFDFYAGLDSSADGRATNINGGSVGMKPSAQDEALGLDERSRIDLPPGAFAEGSNTLAENLAVANPTTTVNVSMSKGRDQALAKTLSVARLGYAPAALELPDSPSAFPDEMWAAMSTYRTAASTSQVGGANPISAFYSIFLPAGIRHQLKQRADLTLSYTLAASTSTTDDKIQVYFYNAVLGRFVPETVNRRLDTVNKTITVSVDHFSTFVVLDSTPVATSTVSFGGADIAVANFPNPADCIVHSNIARNSTLFGSGGVHAPFTGTMIRTSIPLSGSPADLKINIYTVAGERIRTIEQGQVPAGQTYYTPWNCSNDSGQKVASGVYIGEAVHGTRRKFFKIAIIKGSGL